MLLFLFGCSKNSSEDALPVVDPFTFVSATVNGISDSSLFFNEVGTSPSIKLFFSDPIDIASVQENLLFNQSSGEAINYSATYENDNTAIVLKPASSLGSFSNYKVVISGSLKSATKISLNKSITVSLTTGLDSADKFQRIPEEDLFNLVQRQTFKYFWDFAHPVSGLARERITSGETVTLGGSGFGVMAIVTGIHRGFITREEGLARMQKIVAFLKNKAQRFHGAYPHWLNGTTGQVQPFSAKDNGADLVETSFLMQGLLTARQYFSNANSNETVLRDDINAIWNTVEWSWFRKNNENVLYWHWSPDFQWEMNMPIKGWNEGLITYVLAASSTTYPIPKSVYDNGWANNGSIRNGNLYYGVQLPLGPANGGPLFFSHYSFLGINPNGLKDAYADYEIQTKAHSLINYKYCVANPKKFYGYSGDCWGLTASDDINGYLAHEPNNDNGVISPTAALSSFPYTPVESMKALNFFYYKLGDKLWKDYGFIDAFSLYEPWFASSYLAIDQGPIIIMIENHRSKLLWNLFMSCPEVKTGMKTLGFSSPNL